MSVPYLICASPVGLVTEDAMMLASVSSSMLNIGGKGSEATTPRLNVGRTNICYAAVSPARTKVSAA